jgi:virginiamycin B lyase
LPPLCPGRWGVPEEGLGGRRPLAAILIARVRGSGLLPLLLLLALLLGACADSSAAAGNPQINTQGLPYNISVTSIREFPVQTPQSGLMRPAVDSAGNIWFGEMAGNQLGRLNPRTGQVKEWKPPNADFGIMGIVADKQNHIWFAEQNAGYIGEFFPETQTFKVYPTTPRPDKGPSGPNDLAFDHSGNLWFTEQTADRIGRLNVATGQLREYPLPGSTQNHLLAPYGLAIDAKGYVWVGELSGGKLVRLDPATGAIQNYTPPTANASIMEVAAAPDGAIWFAEYDVATSDGKHGGNIGRLDPTSGKMQEYAVPAIASGSSASGVYGLVVDASGAVWFTDVGDNAVGQFQPASEQFTFYPIPTAQSVPFGLAIDSARNVWFTEGANSANAVGMVPGTSA